MMPHTTSVEFTNTVRDYARQALVESLRSKNRTAIERLSWWTTTACWESDNGGAAYLVQKGVSIGDATAIPRTKERLRVFEPYASAWGLTTYDMTSAQGDIYVYHTMVLGTTWRDVLQVERAQRQERAAGLAKMDNEEGLALYRELRRGASGLFALAMPDAYD